MGGLDAPAHARRGTAADGRVGRGQPGQPARARLPRLTRNMGRRVGLGMGKEVAMAVKRLNHAVLYVRDVSRTVRFYEEALGFRVVAQFPGAAFLQVPGSQNDHDLGLFEVGPQAGPSPAGRTTVGLYHLAWEVETLGEL